MEWKFWQKPGPRGLSEVMTKAVTSQYRLDAPTVSRLQFVEKPGQFSGRRVRYIRIFDPSLMMNTKVATLKYDDLQNHVYRQALLFEGHTEKDGSVILSDRRPARSESRSGRA